MEGLQYSMVSIKKMVDCLEYFPGVPPNMSIIRDFFFYRFGRPRQKLSLLRQVQLLRGKHFHINIIKVGNRKKEMDGKLVIDLEKTKAYYDDISTAIQKARQIYAQVDIGIARILYYHIDSDRANGHEIIDNEAEAKSLTAEWTVNNNGIDVLLWMSLQVTQ